MYVAFHTGLKIKSFKQQVGAFIMSCCVYILSIIAYPLNKLHLEISNWASEASPTLGCSIEISRDIYMCMCLSYVKLTA